MAREWTNGLGAMTEGAAGAARFAEGRGRHGGFDEI
jgi:hypothetical protein